MNKEDNKLAHIDCECIDEEMSKLSWNLDNFDDYEPEDEPDEYEEEEKLFNSSYNF